MFFYFQQFYKVLTNKTIVVILPKFYFYMKIIAMIPARYESTRFPRKLMQLLGDKSVILTTYQATKNTDLFDDVIVVTDSEIIYNEITSHNGKAIMSVANHESGSDRIAEAVQNIDADVVFNVQGDEPFTNKESLMQLLNVFKDDAKEEIDLASLMIKIEDWKEIENPNNVKVVVNNENFALYFSRAVIPYPRDKKEVIYFKHIGIYAFRKKALLKFNNLPMSNLEKIEKLENLRFLANNMKVKMVETTHMAIGIDTVEDLEKARKML